MFEIQYWQIKYFFYLTLPMLSNDGADDVKRVSSSYSTETLFLLIIVPFGRHMHTDAVMTAVQSILLPQAS